MFMQGGIMGNIKGLICDCSSKKRAQEDRLDATSPELFQDSIIITAEIIGKKKWDTAVIDLSGELLHEDM